MPKAKNGGFLKANAAQPTFCGIVTPFAAKCFAIRLFFYKNNPQENTFTQPEHHRYLSLMRNSDLSCPAFPAPRIRGKHLLSALLIGTALCLPVAASAQNTSELYNAPLQAPVSGMATPRGQYVIPGTRPASGSDALPSPKLLKRPDELPSISLPATAAPVRRTTGTMLPSYPTTRTVSSGSAIQRGGVVKVIPPVIIESPMDEGVQATVTTIPVQPEPMPFAKRSAPLTASAPVAKPALIAPPAVVSAPVVIAPVATAPAIVPTPTEKPLPERIPAPQPVAPVPTAPVVVAAPQRPEPIIPLAEENDAPLPWQSKNIAETPPVVVAEPEPAPIAPVVSPAPVPLSEPVAAPVEFAEVPSAEAPAPAPVLIPQTVDEETQPIIAAPVQEVVAAPAPELSEKSRFILEQTPKGVAPKKEVIARSPKPVIIKREDPSAGNIPTFDVRAHEEMGMKIEVRKTNPNVNQYLDQGYENLIAGRYQIAAGYYEEALSVEPRNENAMFGLGTTYQKLGRNEEARDTYAKLLSYNPTHLEGLNNFMALISEEAPEEAIAELERMEKESPDFSPIPAQLGIIFSKQGNYAKAAEKLARALNLSPENNAYKYNLAIALDKLGQGQAASDLYVQLINASNAGQPIPGDPETIRNRIIFLSQKQP